MVYDRDLDGRKETCSFEKFDFQHEIHMSRLSFRQLNGKLSVVFLEQTELQNRGNSTLFELY